MSPAERRIRFAQQWLEQVRDHLADAGAQGSPLSPEQLNILSGKVAGGLEIFVAETRAVSH
ncbi:DUF6374 family protein [Nocardia stercoris]|uniref:Transcriptional regulator n=1 Tax=Nocardia stercoris TaxID=2483361 RepID=A0A3M2LA57_9NOCA|nr:DUF6374 family protein [Nocardia stercoris]RMI34294.1 hypothetical protein EBN03_07820 [Nocardia stercoris]